jgi:hypothetical protein
MVTTVRNIRDGGYDPTNPNHVYIGRGNRGYGLPSSKWRNKYPMYGERGRLQCIALFEAELERTPELLAALPELKGKTLWCWCHPKPCHGDVLAEHADRATPTA